MTVRPFDWRDLLALYRYRHQSVLLDSALSLTRGPMIIPGALFSSLAPGMGVYTGVANDREHRNRSLIGQVIHTLGSQYAYLTFLAPVDGLDSPSIIRLLDYLVFLSGERGALRLLADTDERSMAFEALRRAGFATYTRQRIWQLSYRHYESLVNTSWRTAGTRDGIAIRSLYNNVVPGLVQQVEPFPERHPHGVVYYQDGDLLAYVEIRSGHYGIWAHPFVHPDAQDVHKQFSDLLKNLPTNFFFPHSRSRPLYICIRSYQSWLESALDELGAEVGPRQAVMVKHLALPQKAVRTFALPALESGQSGISAPVARTESK
jgi:hypothetical protein